MEPSCQYLRGGFLVSVLLSLFVVLGCFGFGFVLVCVVSASLFVLTRLRFGSVCAPLSNPQRGIQCMQCVIRSISTTMYDDLESHRGTGRKKIQCQIHAILT